MTKYDQVIMMICMQLTISFLNFAKSKFIAIVKGKKQNIYAKSTSCLCLELPWEKMITETYYWRSISKKYQLTI